LPPPERAGREAARTLSLGRTAADGGKPPERAGREAARTLSLGRTAADGGKPPERSLANMFEKPIAALSAAAGAVFGDCRVICSTIVYT